MSETYCRTIKRILFEPLWASNLKMIFRHIDDNKIYKNNFHRVTCNFTSCFFIFRVKVRLVSYISLDLVLFGLVNWARYFGDEWAYASISYAIGSYILHTSTWLVLNEWAPSRTNDYLFVGLLFHTSVLNRLGTSLFGVVWCYMAYWVGVN